MSDSDWNGKGVMIHYYKEGEWDQREILILINMERDAKNFSLPTGRAWQRILDTQAFFDTGDISGEPDGYFTDTEGALPARSANITLENPRLIEDSEYYVAGSSIVILEEQ